MGKSVISLNVLHISKGYVSKVGFRVMFEVLYFRVPSLDLVQNRNVSFLSQNKSRLSISAREMKISSRPRQTQNRFLLHQNIFFVQ